MGEPNAIYFDGANLSDRFSGIDIQRSLLPESRLDTLDVAGRDGMILNGRTYRPVEITVTGTLRATDAMGVSEARHALATMLSATEPKRLVLPDDPDKFYMAVVEGDVSMSRNHDHPKATIRFLAPGVAAYGATQRSRAVNGATEVTVGGNYPTYPTVEVPSAGGTFRITNDAKGEFVEVYASGAISIDMEGETVSAGTMSIYSDFFSLDPGTYNVTSTAQCTMRWYERWV